LPHFRATEIPASNRGGIVRKRASLHYNHARMRLLANWLLSTVALLIVARVVPGFYVSGIGAAVIAALVIGLINATVGWFLKIVTFPLTIITLGIFWIIINALMLEVATWFVRGFQIHGFGAAFIGAIVLSLVNMLLRWVFLPKQERE
jgi:putative membrane protein